MVKWNVIFDVVGRGRVEDFVDGAFSGRQLTEVVSYTEAASEVRKLLRTRGVDNARVLARKALARR